MHSDIYSVDNLVGGGNQRQWHSLGRIFGNNKGCDLERGQKGCGPWRVTRDLIRVGRL